jgi:hypothetical protein
MQFFEYALDAGGSFFVAIEVQHAPAWARPSLAAVKLWTPGLPRQGARLSTCQLLFPARRVRMAFANACSAAMGLSRAAVLNARRSTSSKRPITALRSRSWALAIARCWRRCETSPVVGRFLAMAQLKRQPCRGAVQLCTVDVLLRFRRVVVVVGVRGGGEPSTDSTSDDRRGSDTTSW